MDTRGDDSGHPSSVGLRLPRHLRGQPEVAVVDRVVTERGELVLRRAGDDYEVVSNGVFLMDTRDGRSERLLVRSALDLLAADAGPAHVLIGGLGVGFSLAEAVHDARVATVTVVEIEPAVVEWHRTHLRTFSAGALDDERVSVVLADLREHLAVSPGRYDVACIDIDNGPTWTVTPENEELYGDTGTSSLVGALRAGGVIAVWSAQSVPAYEERLRRLVGDVQKVTVDVARGEPDVLYLARRPQSAGSSSSR